MHMYVSIYIYNVCILLCICWYWQYIYIYHCYIIVRLYMYIYIVYDYQLIIETNRDPDSARRFSGRRIAVDLRMCSLRPQGGPWWPGVVADRRSKSPALGSTNVQQTCNKRDLWLFMAKLWKVWGHFAETLCCSESQKLGTAMSVLQLEVCTS